VLDFNRETGWEVPAERGDSLGGLVFNTLGHAPRQGERVSLPGFELTVVGVSGSRITRVRIARGDASVPEEGESREG
jgi:CBS domain containing-hemolysin-like protein